MYAVFFDAKNVRRSAQRAERILGRFQRHDGQATQLPHDSVPCPGELGQDRALYSLDLDVLRPFRRPELYEHANRTDVAGFR
jgi:hypothetical protein